MENLVSTKNELMNNVEMIQRFTEHLNKEGKDVEWVRFRLDGLNFSYKFGYKGDIYGSYCPMQSEEDLKHLDALVDLYARQASLTIDSINLPKQSLDVKLR